MTGVRSAGHFCWVNMLTPQPDAARDFFAALLGWSYVELPGVGHLVQVGGRNFGGLFDLASPQTPPGTAPCLGVMVKVDSADDAARKVAALGGRTKPPFDIPGSGRMAVCFDPAGAEFDVWQAGANPGMDVDPMQPGAPSWFELLTRDLTRIVPFYTALFGWTTEVVKYPDFSYTVFKHGAAIAGAMEIQPSMGPIPPHWITYFTVRDVDATAKQAAGLGAKICVPPTDIPNVGRFCGLVSPQGVTFWTIEYRR